MSKIVMPVGDGFEDSEFQVPYDRLHEAGHEVLIVGLETGQTLRGKRGESQVTIEANAQTLNPDDFDAMVIPGGHGPDRLRMDQALVDFVRAFVRSGKPVAAICHGPQLLIEAEVVRGRTVTSWPSVRKDLINAGAHWVDQPLVEDGNLITSRKPDDLTAFTRAITQRL
jgi:protease I